MESNFSQEFFIEKDSALDKFVKLNSEHFEEGIEFAIYSNVAEIDLTSEESQYKML